MPAVFWPLFFAILTGLFWGAYGPVLGNARAYEASPFKPYVLIGVAYLVWAVLGGFAGMKYKGDQFSFTPVGSAWGFAAGSLGAFGALALTLAMYSGGIKIPQVVMPTVFGTAVTVSALIAVCTTDHKVNPLLWVGVVGMGISIVTVAYFTPHATPGGQKPKPAAVESSSASQAQSPQPAESSLDGEKTTDSQKSE